MAYQPEYDEEDMMYSDEVSQDEAEMMAENVKDDYHLMAEELDGVQENTFVISMTASLEQLASNSAKAQWQMSPEMQKLLRQVVGKSNRTNAGDDRRVGDLSKTVILGAELIEQRNEFPLRIGLNIPGMVPRTFDRDTRHNWIFEKNTPTTTMSESLFEPDNMFTRYMYEKMERLDMEALNDQIRFDKNPESVKASIDPSGFAWKMVMKNARKGNFPGFNDHLFEINADVQQSGENVFARVPVEVARDMYEAIKAPLETIHESFVDLRKFTCNFERTDKQHWNSTSNLIGASAGQDKDTKNAMKDHALTTEYTVSCKIKMKHITY